MAINFPNNPVDGDSITSNNGVIYTFSASSGNVWTSRGSTLLALYSNVVYKSGNTMTGNLVMSGANVVFVTSTNSGVYWSNTTFIHSPAANVIAIGTSSAEDIRIDSSGNVGIGTILPIASLDVSGSFSVAKANALNQILTDGVTINWDTSLGQVATVTLAGNRTLRARRASAGRDRPRRRRASGA